MKSVALYLGAHKTATTHLQGILGLGRAWLGERDISLSLPQDLRKAWLPDFFRWACGPDRAANETLSTRLRAFAPPTQRWILTDENIVGVSNDLMIHGGIYPMAGERLAALLELFNDREVELFFSIRSYAGFYRSAYSEVVRNRGYIPFSRFYDESRFRDNSWLQTVHAFRKCLPGERITLWCYEDFSTLLPTLIRLITGEDSVDTLLALDNSEPTRPSLSCKTMEILSMLDPVLKRRESLALVERINRTYPVTKDNRVFDPFTSEQKAAMHVRYLSDVASIRAEFPDVRFLSPTP